MVKKILFAILFHLWVVFRPLFRWRFDWPSKQFVRQAPMSNLDEHYWRLVFSTIQFFSWFLFLVLLYDRHEATCWLGDDFWTWFWAVTVITAISFGAFVYQGFRTGDVHKEHYLSPD